MILEVSCTDVGILPMLKVIKNIFDLIQIIAPIVAIISLGIILTKIVTTSDINDIGKLKKKFTNALLALAIVFLIPSLVNLSMTIVGNKFVVSECWNSIDKISLNSKSVYIEKNDFVDKNKDGKDDTTGKQKVSVYTSEKDYYNKVTPSGGTGTYSNYTNIPITSCGNLVYCNKFLTSLYNQSKRLNDAIIKSNAPVDYNWPKAAKTWEGAIAKAQRGELVTTTCVVPANWGVTDAIGKHKVLNSVGKGGFHGYSGNITKYTKQYIFDGSMSVKTAIQKGIIQPGDIIGVKAHTFAIYSVNKSDGSAVVFDGGHRFTNKCKRSRCSPMFTYSSGTNAGMRLYQIVRWVR